MKRRMKEKEREIEGIPQYTLIKGRYLIGALLGKGACSRVYKAYDTVLETETAVKEFVPFSGDKEGEERVFLEEAGGFFGKYEHPGLTAVTDVFEENGTAYLVSEYLSGGNLREYLKKRPGGKITLEAAHSLLRPVIETAVCLHADGLVHGGIVPERLLFDGEGQLHLTGLGTCGLRTEEKNIPGPWTDVCGIAGIFYECLTGKSPEKAVHHILHKGKQKPVHNYVTVSAGTDQAIMAGLDAAPENRFFDLSSFLRAMNLDCEELEPYTGAVIAMWGGTWIELTTSRAGVWRGKRALLTKKKWKRILLFLAAVAVISGTVSGGIFLYFKNHPEALLSIETEKYKKEYKEHPAEMMTVKDAGYEEIWEAVVSEGKRNQRNGYDSYIVPRDFFVEEHLISNEAEGFGITYTQLKKAGELILETPLKRTAKSWSGMVTRYPGKLERLGIEGFDINTYEFQMPEQTGVLEITSDAVSKRVEKCKLEADKNKIRKFLLEGLPWLVPETYLTEKEINQLLDKAQEKGFLSVDRHGKYSLNLTILDSFDTDSKEVWSLSVCSVKALDKIPEKEERAGSYLRDSVRYEQFLEFIKENAVSKKKEEDRKVYQLTEEAVRKWGAASNIPLLYHTEEELIRHLKEKGYELKKEETEDRIFVYDHGMGALETEFCKKNVYRIGDRLLINLIHDILSGRIYMAGVADTENKLEEVLPLAADMALFLSEDIPYGREELLEEWKNSMGSVKLGDPSWRGLWGDLYGDMGCVVINNTDSRKKNWFVISRYGYGGDSYDYIRPQSIWPED